MTAGDESPLTPPAVSHDDRPASPCVHHERRGHVLVIRMEREAKRNAIDKVMTHGIDEALNLLDDDNELWAGVITGTTAVFSAGTDLKDGSGRTERGGEYGMIRRRRAKPLIAGAVLDADRGYQIGFVNRVTDPGQALTAALELADDICASSPVSVAASLAALAAQHDAGDAAGWAATGEAVERVKASDDLREGVSAFFERRPPRWTGR